MSDRLREALDAMPDVVSDDADVAIAAARRFLALTETGPDYSAASVRFMQAVSDITSGKYEGDPLGATVAFDEHARAIVDAALADYPTSDPVM